jgi:hypothetical protein
VFPPPVFRATLAGTARPRPLAAAAAAATALAVALALTLSACGSSSGQPGQRVIARVGNVTITQEAVAHWASVMAPAGGQSQKHRHEELEQAAEQRLLDNDWLTSEAATLGAPVTGADVDREIQGAYGSPEGRAQYHALLTIGHYTPADVRLEVQANLAAEAIRRHVSAYSHAIAQAQVRSYYRNNLREFHLQERRDIQEIGEIPELARIEQIVAEVKHGVPFSSLSTKVPLERTDFSVIPLEKRIVYLAAFRARPGVLVGPLRINGYYFLLEVTRIEAPRTLSLGEARPTIVSHLSAARHTQLLASITSRLTADTSCSPGHVVQGCKQYRGPRPPGSVLEAPAAGLLEAPPAGQPEAPPSTG